MDSNSPTDTDKQSKWTRVKQLLGRDDSPGHTDYPEVDIRAHRKNAKWTERVGFAAGLIGIAAVYVTSEATPAFAGLTFAALGFWAATSLRLQALEWEVQLERESNE